MLIFLHLVSGKTSKKMFKFCLFFIFSWLLNGFVLATQVGAKEKVYYKQTVTTAALDNGHFSKGEIPIVLEGQPPSSLAIELNSPKFSSTRDVVKKESKIVPKKGVLDKSTEKLDQNQTLLTLDIPLEKSGLETTNKSTVILDQSKQNVTTVSVLSSTEKLNTTHIEPAPVKEELQKQEVANDAVTKKPVKKPKPKPLVTIGGKEADEPIPASPTNKSPLGIPRKIDYIVPVVITITALPLLGVAFYVLYKRGRDYWDKRHYRRMDFLIDGMYNE